MTEDIYLFGEVTEGLTQKVIKKLKHEKFKNVKTLNLWISTPGGYIRDCFGIIDLIEVFTKGKDITINTIGVGEVASAGVFILLLGKNRTLLPNCRVFVHEHVTTNAESQPYSEREKQDKNEKEILNMYVSYTAKKLGITNRKARGFLKKNKWLNEAEIKKYRISTCQNLMTE